MKLKIRNEKLYPRQGNFCLLRILIEAIYIYERCLIFVHGLKLSNEKECI